MHKKKLQFYLTRETGVNCLVFFLSLCSYHCDNYLWLFFFCFVLFYCLHKCKVPDSFKSLCMLCSHLKLLLFFFLSPFCAQIVLIYDCCM